MTVRGPVPERRAARRQPFGAGRRIALTLLVVIAVAAGGPRPSSGQERSESPYRVVRPEGESPHPAVLFVSGCSGFTPHEAPRHYTRVAEDFTARGYVVVFVDYLGARGREDCGGAIRLYEVAGDILAAVAYARSSPFIRTSEISVIGWSMGGGGVLAAIARLPADAPSRSGRPSPTTPNATGS